MWQHALAFVSLSGRQEQCILVTMVTTHSTNAGAFWESLVFFNKCWRNNGWYTHILYYSNYISAHFQLLKQIADVKFHLIHLARNQFNLYYLFAKTL